MKSLIFAAALLALAVPAHATIATHTCIGRVTIHVVTDNGGLNPKGTKELSVGGCHIEDNERILRICPKGSFCHVEGTEGGDETVNVLSVARIRPYEEGVNDYRAGQCFRARPYIDGSELEKLWIKGYHAHQTVKQNRHLDEICFGTRGMKH